MNKKGFTLIELLVVISIIGLLSSIVMSSISTAKMKARDARRIEDLRQIQIALEMYRNDKGSYPPVSSASSYSLTWASLANELVDNKYISKLPIDPINNGAIGQSKKYSYSYLTLGNISTSYCYKYKCYSLVAKLEDPNSPYICSKKQYERKAIIGTPKSWCETSAVQEYKMLYSPIIN